MNPILVLPGELHRIVVEALVGVGTSHDNADTVASAVVLAELDGIPSHGVMRVPYYAEHVLKGRVNGNVQPSITRQTQSVLHVDAGHGFAYPAIAAAVRAATTLAPEVGAVVISIGRSHHSGVLGHPVELLAASGLVGVMFSNTAAVIAAPGGGRPKLGTNPIAFGFPRADAPPLVVDLSMSVVARGKIALAAKRGEPIPAGWALDAQGRPTTDAQEAMGGTIAAMGGAKGAALALALDFLVSVMTGSHFSFESASHFDLEGPRYSNGHLMLVMDPRHFTGANFAGRMEAFCAEMVSEPGVRLAGTRRFKSREKLSKDGILIEEALLAELRRYSSMAGGHGGGGGKGDLRFS